MSEPGIDQLFSNQQFANEYALVDGVQMHLENGERFQIPHPLLKRHLAPGQFVELRIDSPRFSVHPDAPEKCTCPSCNGEATKPILSHEHPASLLPLPPQNVPSRGWGEDFWVEISERQGDYFTGRVDNPLYEARLHEVELDTVIHFKDDHVLAVHPVHRAELLASMEEAELIEFAQWLSQSQSGDEPS